MYVIIEIILYGENFVRMLSNHKFPFKMSENSQSENVSFNLNENGGVEYMYMQPKSLFLVLFCWQIQSRDQEIQRGIVGTSIGVLRKRNQEESIVI